MVSMCLPSDALLQHIPSYLGFSYLGRGVSLHGCPSKVQPLLLTLDKGYLLTAALPDLASPSRQARRRAAAKPALCFIFTTRKPYFIASKPRIAIWLRGTQITSPAFPPLLSQKGTSCHPGLWLLFSSPPVLSGSLGPQQKSRLKFPGKPQTDCGWGSGPRNEAHVAVKGVPSFLVSQCIHELCLSCSLLTVQSCYVYKRVHSLTGKCSIAKSTNHHLGLLRGHNLFVVVTSKTTGHRSPQQVD